MVTINEINTKENYPVKVLQYGEGNFLRGFVDWMINNTNNKGLFKGSVRIIQPLENGLIDMLNDQDGLYTLISRGLFNGEVINNREVIKSIEKGVNPYRDFNEYIESADIPELRFVVSNTTEAGISYREGEKLSDAPQISYPGKLTSLLYRRFKTFNGDQNKGLIIIPCELIDRNGDNLKKIVYKLAEEWDLGKDFISWLDNGCAFFNTLVDRIVTGYPKDEVEKLTEEFGYKDNLIDTAEVFNLWVIEGDSKYKDEFPLEAAGCNVIWTNDMTPYRTRKVRILNGIHTMVCMTAYLYGIETVRECLEHDVISKYIKDGVYNEIIPSVDFDKKELTDFTDAVMERFANPFIEHKLISITLNSVSKYKARVLPTLLEYVELKGKAPKILSLALAHLIYFYRGLKDSGESYQVSDNNEVLEFFKTTWDSYKASELTAEDIVTKTLSNSSFWGQDLTLVADLKEVVIKNLQSILENGVNKTVEDAVCQK